MSDHCDIITLIFVRSPFWIFSTSILRMRADDPQILLHNQEQHTNCVTSPSLGTDLVPFLMYDSNGEPWTGAGKEEAMQLSTSIKTKAPRSRIHWAGTLSATVAAFLAGARSQPDLATTKHSRVFSQPGVSPWAAPDFGMLVASDVSSKSAGLVP